MVEAEKDAPRLGILSSDNLRSHEFLFDTNIYLVGSRRTGKTSAGKSLAGLAGKKFIDADDLLELMEGMTIPEIVQRFGWEGPNGMRDRETQTIRVISEMRGIVCATGGGAVTREQNRKLLKASGVVVYLDVPIQDLVDRYSHDPHRPPLIPGKDPVQEIIDVYTEREPIYREVADIIIRNGNDSTPEKAARTILKEVTKFSKRSR